MAEIIKKCIMHSKDESSNDCILLPLTSADSVTYDDTSTVKDKIKYLVNKIDPDESSYIYDGNSNVSQFPYIEIANNYVVGDRLFIEILEYNGNNLSFVSILGYTDETNYVSLYGKMNVGDSTTIVVDRDLIKIKITFNLSAVEECSYKCKFKVLNNLTMSDELSSQANRITELEKLVAELRTELDELKNSSV